jgi:hypothetical protein
VPTLKRAKKRTTVEIKVPQGWYLFVHCQMENASESFRNEKREYSFIFCFMSEISDKEEY